MEIQVCYEGDLTVELAAAIRRLRGEPNFDKSWRVVVDDRHSAATVLRYLKRFIAADGHLVVARTNPTRSREFLLVRHSVTEGYDYAPLHRELGKLGYPLDLPTSSTHIIKTTDHTNAQLLGDRLEEFCPYDSMMVAGISYDFAVWTATDGMFVAYEGWLVRRAFAEARG